MKNSLVLTFYIAIMVVSSIGHAFAQRPIRMGPASEGEIKAAQAALDTNFDNVKAHKAYIYAMGLDNPLLEIQYKKWMKKYPKNVTIPLTIGTIYFNAEMPQAKEFLLKAAALNPQNGKIWSMLSGDAYTRGQKSLSIVYLEKAALADTSNVNYAAALMFSQDSDPAYPKKLFEFIKRFPTNGQGAQALYWLAERDTNLNEKINYFEQLRKIYPPQKFNWSGYGMVSLADCYLQINAEKALSLINEMPEDKDWTIRKQVAESLIQISHLEQEKNYKEAVIKVNEITLPQFNYIDNFIVLKKADLLQNAGDVKAAYDSLLTRFAKLPTNELYNALLLLGKKMGKDAKQVTNDVETVRYSTATQAYPFNLGLYSSNRKLSLQNLKGKVILLTFWFPGCGPCREEFPHFQSVLNNFKSKDIAYVGIDVDPEQNPYVTPLLKNMHYSFIPLRGTREFAAKYYNVKGEPENFLIDKNGKIIFQDFLIDSHNERTLELMIASLL